MYKLNKARLDYKHTGSSLNVCNNFRFDMIIKLPYEVETKFHNNPYSIFWTVDDNFSVVQGLNWSIVV